MKPTTIANLTEPACNELLPKFDVWSIRVCRTKETTTTLQTSHAENGKGATFNREI